MLVPSSVSALRPRSRQEQGNGPIPSRSQESVGNRLHPLSCAKCGRDYFGECFVDQRGWFGCGKLGHRLRDCPYARKGSQDARPHNQATIAPTPVVCSVSPQVPHQVL